MEQIVETTRLMETVQREIGKAFIGQDTLVRHALITLLAGGHVLVEGARVRVRLTIMRGAVKGVVSDTFDKAASPAVSDTFVGKLLSTVSDTFTKLLSQFGICRHQS
jgi:hypothetical protein